MSDLNDESLLRLFGWLDFENLLAVAENGERFKRLIGENFLRDQLKLHERTICVANEPKEYYENVDCFLINQHKTTLTFLRNFGDMVTQLNIIGNGIDQYKMDQITNYVNQFSSKSLIELTLERIHKNPIIHWQDEFPKLEILNLRKTNDPNGAHIQLIFPKLRRLEIESDKFGSIGYKFAHLEHLKIDAGLLSQTPVSLSLALSLNSQLRSFHMDVHFDVDFLHSINIKLSHLENLGLEYTSIGVSKNTQPVFFENVKEFSFNVYHMPAEKKFIFKLLTFQQLKTLHLTCRSLNADLINFIKPNILLNTVKIMGMHPAYSELVTTIEALPKLVEIHTIWENPEKSSGVLDIMRNENSILSVTLETNDSTRGLLLASIPSSWIMVKEKRTRYDQFLTFSRNSGKFVECIS